MNIISLASPGDNPLKSPSPPQADKCGGGIHSPSLRKGRAGVGSHPAITPSIPLGEGGRTKQKHFTFHPSAEGGLGWVLTKPKPAPITRGGSGFIDILQVQDLFNIYNYVFSVAKNLAEGNTSTNSSLRALLATSSSQSRPVTLKATCAPSATVAKLIDKE